jgi:hypothetical protein
MESPEAETERPGMAGETRTMDSVNLSRSRVLLKRIKNGVSGRHSLLSVYEQPWSSMRRGE